MRSAPAAAVPPSLSPSTLAGGAVGPVPFASASPVGVESTREDITLGLNLCSKSDYVNVRLDRLSLRLEVQDAPSLASPGPWRDLSPAEAAALRGRLADFLAAPPALPPGQLEAYQGAVALLDHALTRFGGGAPVSASPIQPTLFTPGRSAYANFIPYTAEGLGTSMLTLGGELNKSVGVELHFCELAAEVTAVESDFLAGPSEPRALTPGECQDLSTAFEKALQQLPPGPLAEACALAMGYLAGTVKG